MGSQEDISKPPTCLVIGGCGFLGRHLVEKLLDLGYQVHVVDLRVTFADERVKFFNIDLCDVKDLLESMEGVETVFHCATPSPLDGNRKTFHTVNIEGTKHIIDSCLYKKVKNLVLVSSAFVVYTGDKVENGTEELPYATHTTSYYVESKVIQEQLVLGADCDQLNTVALRPSGVFGPRDPHMLPNVARTAARGQGKFIVGLVDPKRGPITCNQFFNLPIFQQWNGQNLMDFVYVENAVLALVMAADNLGPNSKLKGKAYNITNKEPILFWKFVEKLTTGMGYPAPKYHLSYHFVRLLAVIEDFFTGLLGHFTKVTPTLNPFAIEISATHLSFNCDRASRDFQYEPKVKLDDGIRITLDSCPKEYFSRDFRNERTLKMKE